METSKLKRFSSDARINLMAGVRRRLQVLGFDDQGRAERAPELIQGGTLWGGEEFPEAFHTQWTALAERLRSRGVREVVEEAAYTWFNRMMAIRILAKNGLCDKVLSIDPTTGLPEILAEARVGRLPQMDIQQQNCLARLMDDDTRTTDQFALLLTARCHANPIINSCFGAIDDYVALLLPGNILDADGFLALLNDTEFISDDDFHSAELIGWLYQFYISDRKDEVFAKKGKVEADEIPAATQIFTPNWIVKYMVENTILPKVISNFVSNKYEVVSNINNKEEVVSSIREYAKEQGWDYLVVPDADSITSYLKLNTCDFELEELKVADFACGSGHILNECFDLLYKLYMAEAFSRREAIESIFTNNLVGIDIDLRAKQLATFALMLKACQRDASFADAHCLPKVLCTSSNKYEVVSSSEIDQYFMGSLTADARKEIEAAFELLKDGNSLGSIMKFDISPSTRRQITDTVQYWSEQDLPSDLAHIASSLLLITSLTERYDAIVMNPPYMGGGKMDNVLSAYVKKHYKAGSSDLATVFVEMAPQRLNKGGNYAFIIPPSWMFLSGFEDLRRQIIDTNSIQSLLHLSRGIFGADFGSSAAVIKSQKNGDFKGNYFRLIERTFQEFDQKHLQELFLKTLETPAFKYYFKDYSKDVKSIEYSENGAKIYYEGVNQKQFEQIPGSPIAYWVSEKFIKLFKFPKLLSTGSFKKGMSTGDNERFIKHWNEVSNKNIFWGCKTQHESEESSLRWYPINSGGTFRKWHGNELHVTNWQFNGREMKDNAIKLNKGGHWSRYIVSVDRFFKSGLSWNAISSGPICVRHYDTGFLFSSASMCGFSENKYYIIGLLNSSVSKMMLEILAPSMNYGPMQIREIPIIFQNENIIEDLVRSNISISKQDWDAHETSWDFQRNELLSINAKNCFDIVNEYCDAVGVEIDMAAPQPNKLEWLMGMYEMKWEAKFRQLHANEEELNRQFIEIYGLQDELTPDVPLDEVTILQNGDFSILKNGSNKYEVVSNIESNKYEVVSNIDADAQSTTSSLLLNPSNTTSSLLLNPSNTTSSLLLNPSNITSSLLLNTSTNTYTIRWNRDVVMKQLISYIVGCYMGRYRLDRPGLAIAHPEPTEEELAPYTFSITHNDTFTPDSDGIIPVLPSDAPFYDNLVKYVKEFVGKVWEEEDKNENLNFMEQCLGKSLDDYLTKDFWKDHKKMYQNRPIYWEFASKKGAFRALIYAHRMDRFTVEVMRSKYLLPYIGHIERKIAALEARQDELSTPERRELDNLRKKILPELAEYHKRVEQTAAHFAGQPTVFDLDDGIVHNHSLFGDIVTKLK